MERFSFVFVDNALGEIGFPPILPITLVYQNASVVTSGLLDTGASVNVLAYKCRCPTW